MGNDSKTIYANFDESNLLKLYKGEFPFLRSLLPLANVFCLVVPGDFQFSYLSIKLRNLV